MTPIERARIDLRQCNEHMAQHDAAIAHHQAEREKVLAEKQKIETFLTMYDKYAQEDVPVAAQDAVRVRGGLTFNERIGKIAEEINRSTQRRARTGEIYRRAIEAGITVTGKDEVAQKNSISGALTKDKRFNALRGRGYWLDSLGKCPEDEGMLATTFRLIERAEDVSAHLTKVVG